MTVIGKIGRTHGKHGLVKVIPKLGMQDIFAAMSSALVITDGGDSCELENIREYTRGRFLGTLNGFRSRGEVERFRGGLVVAK